MKLRLLAAGLACALAVASPSPARAQAVAGLNMGAPVWNGVVAKDALGASIATGAPQIRVNFRLDKWSSPKDATKYDGRTFFEAYDAIIDAITSQGLEVYGLLSDELVFASPKDPTFDDAWVPNALAVVERYRDRVRVWETINEPNNWDETQTPRMSPAAFARAHAKLYGAVKASGPGSTPRDPCWDVTLVTGPLFSFDGTTGTDYLADAIAAGRAGGAWKAFVDATGRDPIDGIGYHVYVAQGADTPAKDVAAATNANLDALRAMLAARGLGDRKVWLSEVGFRAEVLGAQGQADRLDATFDALAARSDVAAAHWFTVADFGAGESWGLFADGFAPTQRRPSHARFVARAKQHAPALAARITLDAPSPTRAKVTITNLGKETWPSGGNVRLGAAAGCPSASAINELRWATPNAGYVASATDARVFLPRAVAQGESIVLEVGLAPSAVSGRIAMRMVKEGEAWFGATASAPVTIAGTAPPATSPPAAGPTDPRGGAEVSSREPATSDGCRASAQSSPTPTSWLPLLFAVGVVLVFVRRTA